RQLQKVLPGDAAPGAAGRAAEPDAAQARPCTPGEALSEESDLRGLLPGDPGEGQDRGTDRHREGGREMRAAHAAHPAAAPGRRLARQPRPRLLAGAAAQEPLAGGPSRCKGRKGDPVTTASSRPSGNLSRTVAALGSLAAGIALGIALHGANDPRVDRLVAGI